MKHLLWAEGKKLCRSKIVWIAVFAVVMTSVIVFVQGQFTFYGTRFVEGAGWLMTEAVPLATFFVLPAVTALFGSYMICREEQEDTMKALRLVPVDEAKLTAAKMIIALGFSVLVYLMLFAVTFAMEAVMHIQSLSFQEVAGFFCDYFVTGAGIFFAISPVIALVARMKKGYWLAILFAEIYSFAGIFTSTSKTLKTVYPVTAVFTLSGHYEAAMKDKAASLAALLVCGSVAVFLLAGIYKRDEEG